MQIALLDIINFIAMFQLSVFIFFLLRKKSLRQSNNILAFFLFIQILLINNYEIHHNKDYVLNFTPHLFFIGVVFIYLAGPTFYLYVNSLVYRDFRLNKGHLLHAIPFFIMLLIFITNYHIYSSETKLSLIKGNNVLTSTFWIVFNILFLIQILVYFIVDLHILKKYSSEIKQQYSSVKNINLNWLKLIIYGFIAGWLSSVAVLIGGTLITHILNELVFINFFTFFIFFNIIYYKGFAQPEIFSGIEDRQKYVSSKLSDLEAKSYLACLLEFMDSKKPFLNPTLTLKELAGQVGIPARYLSQVINEYTRLNFYDFISQYRIEEAKRILAEPLTNKTVLEVLYEVGFNSKSSFNTAFKKFTGVTPTHFKRKKRIQEAVY